MKNRWSDGHSFAAEFECENENNFYQAAMPALAIAREHTAKRYHHQGENKIYFPVLFLHVMGVQGSWLNSASDRHIYASDAVESSLENMLAGDEFWLSIDQFILWAYCERTYLWSQELERFCSSVCDMIMAEDKKIENRKIALDQFEKLIANGEQKQ